MTTDTITRQLEVLNLKHPFTKEELTHAYRAKAFETHPDRGGKADEFKEVQESYEFLLPLCVLSSDEKSTDTITVEGYSIGDLGLGLGSTVNSTDCLGCQGKGWYEYTHTTYMNLKDCTVCGGSGRIKTIYNYDLLSPFRWKNWRPCRKCFGIGYTTCNEVKHKTLHYCETCKGTGQIEIFNPVLQKGRVQVIKAKERRIKKNYCKCGALLRNGKCWRCE